MARCTYFGARSSGLRRGRVVVPHQVSHQILPLKKMKFEENVKVLRRLEVESGYGYGDSIKVGQEPVLLRSIGMESSNVWHL